MNIKDLLNADISTLFTKKRINKKIGQVPLEYKKNVIVFDIGNKNIKVLIGKKQKEQVIIQKTFSFPTPGEVLLDGKVQNEAILANSLNVALKEAGIKLKDALVTVNSSQIINRELIIDRVAEDELETVIRYELQQFLPINLNDYLVQFTILNEFEEDEVAKYKVFVIAFPDRIAKSYYQLLKLADLKPLSLETTFVSLSKLLKQTKMINQSTFSSKNVTAFLDLGASTIDVHICRDGYVDLTRMIKSGGDDIDQMLSYRHQIPLKSIDKVKKSIDLMKEDADEIVLTARLAVDNLISEVDRILQFYQNKSHCQIESVYLYGGVALMKNLDVYMCDRLNKKVETIKSLNQVNSDENLTLFINALGSLYRQ